MEPFVKLTGVTAPPPEPEIVYLPRSLVLKMGTLELTDNQLLEISAANDILRFELTAKGELVIMPPTGNPSGWRENELAFQVTLWAKGDGTGTAFGASAGFRLPNKAVRAPDVSWILRERWDAWLGVQERRHERDEEETFPAICPDFVLELRSRSETLASQQRKMEEYMENGARLGWLIDPINQRVHIYRSGEAVEVLESPASVSGEPVLPGFELNLQEIW